MARVELKRIKLDEVNPAPYNPRGMDSEEKEKLKGSLLEFGHVITLVVNKRTDNTLVGGNQTHSAFLELREEYNDYLENKDEWLEKAEDDPILKERIEDLKSLAEESNNYTEADAKIIDVTLEREKVINIGLNKISGEFQFDGLGKIFSELEDKGESLYLTGFDEVEVMALLDDDIDFGFGKDDGKLDLSKDDLPEPEIEGKKPGRSYSLHIGFVSQEDAQKFLELVGYPEPEVKGLTKLVDGDKIDLEYLEGLRDEKDVDNSTASG